MPVGEIGARERESPRAGRAQRRFAIIVDAPTLLNRDEWGPGEADLVQIRPAIRFSARITR
jgi:hypothetical protein